MAENNIPRALVVDDDDGVRRLLARVLQGAGWQATAAATATEALEASAAVHHAIAFIDVDLGGQDGVALAAALKRAAPGLPIIMMSGRQNNQHRVSAAGFPFLAKPFDVARLPELLPAKP